MNRQGWGTIGAGIAVGCLAGAWFAQATAEAPPGRLAAAVAVAARATFTPTSAADASRLLTDLDRQPPAAGRSMLLPVSSRSTEPVCAAEKRRTSRSPSRAHATPAEAARAAGQVRDELVRLAASPEPYDRAMALLAADETTSDDAGRRLALATAAAATEDPRLYGAAWRTCIGSDESACRGLTLSRWAQLDPRNAVPWMYVARDAAARGDASSLDDALFHMAHADTVDEGVQPAAEAIMRQRSAGDAGELGALVLYGRVLEAQAAWPLPWNTVAEACAPSALGDANRRELCVSVAARFADGGGSLLLAQQGTMLSGRLTGDATRLQRFQALTAASRSSPARFDGSCASLHDEVASVIRVAMLGERRSIEAGVSTVATAATLPAGRSNTSD